MNIHADKTQERKSQSVANELSQMQDAGESSLQFVDNRPEVIAQRKLQDLANYSPHVRQSRDYQDMPNNSQQAKQTAQFQSVADIHIQHQQQPIQKKEINTGRPDHIKAGMETLSGMSLDDVKVHLNSDNPAQLQAHAYAQGTVIHLGPGQEENLPHESWHVVQQKQGRVNPTMKMEGGVNVNDDAILEKEVDVMPEKEIQQKPYEAFLLPELKGCFSSSNIIQREFKDSAEIRKEKFIKLAHETYGISELNALELYQNSGSDDPDPVTKLRRSTDKEETRKLARDYAAKGKSGEHGDIVFYADIKFYNLAGLNAAKGHAGADDIFGLMATHVDGFLSVLRDRYKIQGYRHEGSRFGFMIVGDKSTLTKEIVDIELEKARLDWDGKKSERGIDKISNPKRPDQPGVDLGFKVYEIDGSREVKESDGSNDLEQSPADQGTSPAISHDFQGEAPGIFKGEAEKRDIAFKAKGEGFQLSEGQIQELYKLAGRSEKEPLTGFDEAGDRIGTLTSAMQYYKENYPHIFAGYIEVDVRNLGGLNDNLSRADSDNVFKFMSDTTDKHVKSLKADVISFRHGGDEFSFVVVGSFPGIMSNKVRTVLTEAQIAVDAYVQHKKIWQKKKKAMTIAPGTGAELTLLNQSVLPPVFEKPFEKEKIMKNEPVIETNTKNKLWSIFGKETYWLIAKRDDNFQVFNIPLELTLDQILHSKDTAKKPRLPGTGIVWGESMIRIDDKSPIDVVARADQQVELKKK